MNAGLPARPASRALDRGPGIVCTAWTPVREAHGKLAGFCDLYVVKLRLRLFGCAVFTTDSGGLRVAMPSRNVARPGKPADWQPCVAWDRYTDRTAFEAAALEALLTFSPDLDEGLP